MKNPLNIRMKKILFFIPLILLSCSHQPNNNDTMKPRTAVTITQVSQGTFNDSIILSATTAYLNKSTITAPIASFVTKVFVEQGTRVQAGQPLFRLESKERNALGLDDNNSAGIIYIKATTSGIITLVKQQGGDYVTEGAILCEIANQNSLVFEINVPYEYTQYVAGGKNCTITLPDGKVLNAQIGSPMASMNTASQSQLYKAKANVGFLPEGLIAKVSILKKASVSSSQILPRQAVQCDVSMQKYWIMRLANDSLAVKQEVQVGNGDKSNIEILSPVLSPSERIVLDGSYAMEDSTLVKIIK
jgi:biotin carboxyl carrier protein